MSYTCGIETGVGLKSMPRHKHKNPSKGIAHEDNSVAVVYFAHTDLSHVLLWHTIGQLVE